MEEKEVVINTENEKQLKKKELEALCKKIMSVVIPCICLVMVLAMIFKGSKDARSVKKVLKAEDCKAKIYEGTEVSEVLEELDLEIKNVDELVAAVDKDDVEVFAFVFFCESRMDAEEAEEMLEWYIYTEPDSEDYSVERNGKIVCFGYVDLVDAVMEELD